MHLLGLDCHLDQHTWALLDHSGQLLDHGQVPNEPAALQAWRAQLPPDVQVGLEGPRPLRSLLEQACADLPCFEISPHWTHERRRHGPRPDKDDRSDAERVARALLTYRRQLVPLPRPDEQLDALRALLHLYHRATAEVQRTAQRLHAALLALWGPAYQPLFGHALSVSARRFWAAYPTPWRLRGARRLGDRLRRWARRTPPPERLAALRQLGRTASPPTAAQQLYAEELQRLLPRYEQLRTRQRELHAQLRTTLVAMQAHWLLQEPALGPLRAAELIAGGLLQSPGPSGFARRCGLAPEAQRSGRHQRDVNTRQRHAALFQTMMDWATTLRAPQLHCAPATEYYQRKRQEGKTHLMAQRCLARRLVDRLFKLRAQQQQPFPGQGT